MAQEAILNVSLKDYKKNIDELRASLLGLEKDSDDYKKIAEELKDKQDKLNEVMSVGKEAVNAVDGSYNQLSATLSQLKKEWKNIEMGTPEWEAMAVRINDINNQLKEADASVGVFTRNVGDYANAFEEAFKQAAGGLGQLPGILGSIGSTTTKLIPLIKKVNQTAVAGLNGIKKALVSTGIGALIVAVGVLIANFDKLGKLFKSKDNPVEKIKKDFDALTRSIKATNDEIEYNAALLEAQGADEETVMQTRIKGYEDWNLELAETYKKVQKEHEEIKKGGGFFKRLFNKEEIQEALKENEKVQEKIFNTFYENKDKIKKIENDINVYRVKKGHDAAESEKKELNDILKKVKENSKSEIQALTDKYNEELALLKKYGKDSTELTKQYNDNIEKINKRALDAVFSELGKYDQAAEFQWNFEKASEQVEAFQKIVNRKFPPEGLLEVTDVTKDMIEQAKELGLVQGNTALEFTIAWQNAYERYKSIAKDLSASRYEDSEEWQEYMDRLWDDERYSLYYKNLMANAQGTFNAIEEAYKDYSGVLKEIEAGTFDYAAEGFDSLEEAALWYKTLIPELEKLMDKYGKDIEDIMKASEKYQNELTNKEIEQRNIIYNGAIAASELGTQWFYDVYQKRLEAAQWFRDNLEIIEGETEAEHMARIIAADQTIVDIQKEYAQKHMEIAQTLSDDFLSIWDSTISIRESQLKKEENAEVKALRERLQSQGKGEKEINEAVQKVRDEYGRKAFEESKKSKISLGWVETIQGALAAFMGYQDFPQPYGAILGAAAAATTMAAGIAQIEAIKASEYGVSSNSSSPVAVVNATPRLADYSPDTVTNLTGASEVDSLKNALQETPIYVSVTDINNAQAKVSDRDKESSF